MITRAVFAASPRIPTGVFASVRASRIGIRAYSDKPEQPKEAQAEEKPAADGEAAKEDSVEARLAEKDERIKQLQEQLLYARADIQNIQRRAAEEKTAAGNFAITKLAKDLTASIDVLDLALKSVPEEYRELNKGGNAKGAERVLADLYDGVGLTRKSVIDMLRTHGIEAFNPVGQPFDPKHHEALFQAPVPGKEPGTVLDCSKVGYMIKGRLLRAAEVGVVQDIN
ncbi:GrpE, mitochondrial [Malassezia cuniculi]|uniref:GrpE protein homolog n=1 Tax=Malassezia cuniculi TaxID=948313 RepID=A0AAF0EWP2_9BASI|nr:GrpE, mitochondrial [Malassezia cuniculi]